MANTLLKIRLILIFIGIAFVAYIKFFDKNDVLAQIAEDKSNFQESISDKDKALLQRYIDIGADERGPVNHNRASGLLILWGGKINRLSEFHQYRDSDFEDRMNELGYKIVEPEESPPAILLISTNHVKVKEYEGNISGYRTDLSYVYFDLQKQIIYELGDLEGETLPNSIRVRVSSNIETYYGREAPLDEKINFVDRMLTTLR